jgi:hypothetical protein
MFDVGQKLIILASSIKNGTTGPRKGSIGFSCGTTGGNTFVISDVFPNTHFIINVNNMIFSRFGFEKKNRAESKNIIAVLPIFIDKQGLVANTNINNVIKNIESPAFIMEKLKPMLSMYVQKPTSYPICVLAPYMDILYLEDEFVPWFLSFRASSTFRAYINTVWGKTEINNPDERNVIGHLYSMIFDNSIGSKNALLDKQARNVVITTMQKSYAFIRRQEMKGILGSDTFENTGIKQHLANTYDLVSIVTSLKRVMSPSMDIVLDVLQSDKNFKGETFISALKAITNSRKCLQDFPTN